MFHTDIAGWSACWLPVENYDTLAPASVLGDSGDSGLNVSCLLVGFPLSPSPALGEEAFLDVPDDDCCWDESSWDESA